MSPEAHRRVFVNLAVEDLVRSVAFFRALGFRFDDRFSNHDAACMVLNDAAFVMLIAQKRFLDFTTKQLCDLHTHTETLIALSCERREDVDRMVAAAVENGGRATGDPTDHLVMYGWSFEDPDGHIWEVVWLDPITMAMDEEQ